MRAREPTAKAMSMTRRIEASESPEAVPSGSNSASEQLAADKKHVRGTVLMAFRDAALALWGEPALEEIGTRLSDAARKETVLVSAVNLGWVPESYVLEWYEALWHGPCAKRRDNFLKFLDRMMDAGFGRVRKTLVGFANPAVILKKAPDLWAHDHSHGKLTLISLESESAKVRLSSHPYTSTSLSRLATAEIYRYCVTLCRARDVTEVHYREPDGSLVVAIRWTS
jgi:hypothetical protein